jgi:hypothetical protein
MNRGLLLRLAKLEAKRREDPIILNFADARPSRSINGTSRHFFRLIDQLNSKFPKDSQTLCELKQLREATSIDGRNAQLFALAQALAKGPLDTTRPIKSRELHEADRIGPNDQRSCLLYASAYVDAPPKLEPDTQDCAAGLHVSLTEADPQNAF